MIEAIKVIVSLVLAIALLCGNEFPIHNLSGRATRPTLLFRLGLNLTSF